MKIGELADATGVSVRSLRYYEQQGLISPDRTAGGHRRYGAEVTDRVRLIRRLYSAGLTSPTVALLLVCEETQRVSPNMVDAVRRQQFRTEQQISQLTEANTKLEALLATMNSPNAGRSLRTSAQPDRPE